MGRPKSINPYGIRTTNPTVWPQYPYDATPHTPEQSAARYEIQQDWNHAVAVRDGTKLLLDIYRPSMIGAKFPALVSFSPYTRQLQRDTAPIGQNEAGISEFWVPRGYAHVIVDVRGTNGSGGSWDMLGPTEQADMADIIEWVAEQPWCNGNVGMMGCSYFAMTQNLAAQQQPPSLKAIFPYDASTDIYRDFYFPGGLIGDSFTRIWFSDITFLNFWGGRNPNTAGLNEKFFTILGRKYPLDGPFYWERSAWPNLDKIQVPAYFGCHWPFYNLHLRGSFDAWLNTGDIPKKMLIGPAPLPQRLYANYHMEALRWYDQWLKGMDTRVMEGGPIHLWIEGDDCWREEQEWPLARTQWTEFYLGGSMGSGTLSDGAPAAGTQELDYNPLNEDDTLRGLPRLVYRSEPVSEPLEITGPIQLNLHMASSAEDTDWIVAYLDEAPDGSVTELSRGWLRSSHRAVDPTRSRRNMPWHPHDRVEPLDARCGGCPADRDRPQLQRLPAGPPPAPGNRQL